MALTFHINASVDTDLWQVNTAGVLSDHPTNGEDVNYADDVAHGGILAGVQLTPPTWNETSPLMLLPSLAFSGVAQSFQVFAQDGSTPKILSDLISASEFTIFIAFRVDTIATAGANVYDDDAIIADVDGYFGVHLIPGTPNKIACYNFDTTVDVVELDIELETSYVLMYRHEGGSIYASLNGGSESSTASGNTNASGLAVGVCLAKNTNAVKFYDGRIGEMKIYNTALSGSTLTDQIDYFMGRWISSPSSGNPQSYYNQQQVA